MSRRCGSKGKWMADAGVPASIADRAAIVAALQVLCALPECARGALNARPTKNPRLYDNYSGPLFLKG